MNRSWARTVADQNVCPDVKIYLKNMKEQEKLFQAICFAIMIAKYNTASETSFI